MPSATREFSEEAGALPPVDAAGFAVLFSGSQEIPGVVGAERSAVSAALSIVTDGTNARNPARIKEYSALEEARFPSLIHAKGLPERFVKR